MRLKSVCKHWQYSMQNDSLLIDLHFTRSKQRPVINLLFSTSLATKDELTSVNNLAVHEHQYQEPVIAAHSRYNVPGYMSKPVNGLICFLRIHDGHVRIANITTGQETPWIKLTLKGHDQHVCYIVYLGFGFDPASKQHKVVCIYRKGGMPNNGVDDEIDEVCEVMTLARNNNYTWRRIDVYPQYVPDTTINGTYVNGSIYWLSDGVECTSHWKRKNPNYKEEPLDSYNCEGVASLVAFDVGKEEFRTIIIPGYVAFSPEASYPSLIQDRGAFLLVVSGHIALDDSFYAKKLWVFIDDYHHGGGGKWIGETVSIDLNSFYNMEDWKGYSLEDSVHGTDEIIVMIIHPDYDPTDRFCVCYYNWKTKAVRNRVEISTKEMNTFYDLGGISTFTESLFPV